MKWWNLVESYSLCHWPRGPSAFQAKNTSSFSHLRYPLHTPAQDLGFSWHPVATFDRWKAILGPTNIATNKIHMILKCLLPIFLVPPPGMHPHLLHFIWYLQVFYIVFGDSFPEPLLPIYFAYYLGPCQKNTGSQCSNEGYIIGFPFIKN